MMLRAPHAHEGLSIATLMFKVNLALAQNQKKLF